MTLIIQRRSSREMRRLKNISIDFPVLILFHEIMSDIYCEKRFSQVHSDVVKSEKVKVEWTDRVCRREWS